MYERILYFMLKKIEMQKLHYIFGNFHRMYDILIIKDVISDNIHEWISLLAEITM